VSVAPAVLRRFEGLLEREVALIDGRKATLRVVDACDGEISCCVELPGQGLIWIDSDQVQLPDDEMRGRKNGSRLT
jgi:hypothetical protein